ncbi:hypothetical protein [Mesoterricola sediminis]|uniref:Tetratricopeptide repeat protein n=1 Tax=Mesoterricola sediminis TaxID=2927980 RepID=A0AA48H3P4_9BACT|nr:hypothetical protein [Mesoterricola sediminis]BDU76891.1 hypothetical protein METESE_18490 [Mesoterricola sediminis]
MAIKPKTNESPVTSADMTLEDSLTAALAKLGDNDLKAAQAAFEAVQAAALQAEAFPIARTAQSHLAAIAKRLDGAEAPAEPAPELAVQVQLNRRDPEAALGLAEAALKARPDHAGLHYLKALSLALLDRPQESADALTQATSLDPGLIYQFRLEPDFDAVRQSGPFAVFNRG